MPVALHETKSELGAAESTSLHGLVVNLDLEIAKRGGRKNCDYYPVRLPQLTGNSPEELERSIAERFALRELIRARITELYLGSFLPIYRDHPDGPYVYPPPWDGLQHPAKRPVDLTAVVECVNQLLDPADPDFNKAVVDLEAGAIRLLIESVYLGNTDHDPYGMAELLKSLAAPIDDSSISSVPWDTKRREVLVERRQALQVKRFGIQNARLMNELMARFSNHRNIFVGMLNSLAIAGRQCGITEYEAQQYFNVLISKSDAHVAFFDSDIAEAYKLLIADMACAEEKQELRRVIDTFALKTLPQLVAEREAARKKALEEERLVPEKA